MFCMRIRSLKLRSFFGFSNEIVEARDQVEEMSTANEEDVQFMTRRYHAASDMCVGSAEH